MDEVRSGILALINAHWPEGGMVPVFGEGDPGARVMLIGEAPGEQETLQGRPFAGKAGRNLDEFLRLAGLDRRALYVTNVVKVRPTKRSAAGRVVNRPPTRAEVHLFLPWLLREIDAVDPECIVTLGNVPLQALTDRATVIGDVHGRLTGWEGRLMYPMYHPASVIYNPALRDVYREDVVRFGDWLRSDAV